MPREPPLMAATCPGTFIATPAIGVELSRTYRKTKTRPDSGPRADCSTWNLLDRHHLIFKQRRLYIFDGDEIGRIFSRLARGPISRVRALAAGFLQTLEQNVCQRIRADERADLLR